MSLYSISQEDFDTVVELSKFQVLISTFLFSGIMAAILATISLA